jgi:hypothetical protein
MRKYISAPIYFRSFYFHWHSLFTTPENFLLHVQRNPLIDSRMGLRCALTFGTDPNLMSFGGR